MALQACPPQGFPFWGLPPSVLAQLGQQRPQVPLPGLGQGRAQGLGQGFAPQLHSGLGGLAAAAAAAENDATANQRACQDCTGTSEPAGASAPAPAGRLHGSDGGRWAALGGILCEQTCRLWRNELWCPLRFVDPPGGALLSACRQRMQNRWGAHVLGRCAGEEASRSASNCDL